MPHSPQHRLQRYADTIDALPGDGYLQSNSRVQHRLDADRNILLAAQTLMLEELLTAITTGNPLYPARDTRQMVKDALRED